MEQTFPQFLETHPALLVPNSGPESVGCVLGHGLLLCYVYRVALQGPSSSFSEK